MNTPTNDQVRRFYDRLAGLYDWTTFFEGRAKRAALQALAPQPGMYILTPGVGTGREQAIIQEAIGTEGLAVGLDISRSMLRHARQRGLNALVQGDIQALPLAPQRFDAIYCTYLLDLLPANSLPDVLSIFYRWLRPGGRAVLLTLTEGISPVGKASMRVWNAIYRLAPLACGGCRQLRLAALAAQTGFRIREDRVIEEWGMPSNLLHLEKPL